MMANKLTGAAFMLALAAACAGGKTAAPNVIAGAGSTAQPISGDEDQSVGAFPPEQQFVELGLDGLSSPFTKETVLKLNAIVGRSLTAVKEYDGVIARIQASVGAAAIEGASGETYAEALKGLTTIRTLSAEASLARDDLRAAEDELKSSGENYNEAILAGMIVFVAKVDDELRRATENLESKLGAK